MVSHRRHLRPRSIPQRCRCGLYPHVSCRFAESLNAELMPAFRLSWSDTTASTIGRLWGRYTRPLPSHFPGLPFLRFAPRKSLAGFLAATFTGIMICIGFWWSGSKDWRILDGQWPGLLSTAFVVGVGGAIVEALGELSGAICIPPKLTSTQTSDWTTI